MPLWTALQLNMANIYWELQDYKMTVSHCDAVVSHEHALNLLPLSAFRAHYRRGMALHALEESEKALADCCGPTESVTEMLAKKRPRT